MLEATRLEDLNLAEADEIIRAREAAGHLPMHRYLALADNPDEVTGAETAHLASCADCRRRIEEFKPALAEFTANANGQSDQT